MAAFAAARKARAARLAPRPRRAPVGPPSLPVPGEPQHQQEAPAQQEGVERGALLRAGLDALDQEGQDRQEREDRQRMAPEQREGPRGGRGAEAADHGQGGEQVGQREGMDEAGARLPGLVEGGEDPGRAGVAQGPQGGVAGRASGPV